MTSRLEALKAATMAKERADQAYEDAIDACISAGEKQVDIIREAKLSRETVRRRQLSYVERQASASLG